MQNITDATLKIKTKIEIASCNELWISVIDQALVDALSNSQQSRNKKNKLQAIKWLLWDDKNFDQVCQLAGIDAKRIRDKIIQIIAFDKCRELNFSTIIKISNVDQTLKDNTIRAIQQLRKEGRFVAKNNALKPPSRHYHLRHNYSVLRQLKIYQ